MEFMSDESVDFIENCTHFQLGDITQIIEHQHNVASSVGVSYQLLQKRLHNLVEGLHLYLLPARFSMNSHTYFHLVMVQSMADLLAW